MNNTGSRIVNDQSKSDSIGNEHRKRTDNIEKYSASIGWEM